MATIALRPIALREPIVRAHCCARPLPEPPRYKHVSRVGMPAVDRLGRLLEEWLADMRISYTEPGD